MDLSIIIVSYNTKDLLADCLDSVYKSTDGLDFEILVIDNGSTDGSVTELKVKFPDVRIVSNDDNRGFAAANNQGLRLMRGEYALLLNPDTQMAQATVARMLGYLKDQQTVGIVGCKVLNPDGALQPSAFPLPTLKDLMLSGLAANWLSWGRLVRRHRSGHYLPGQMPMQVGWVSGACLMIRRKTIDQIGLLDENFFLFSEDVDWCMRANRKGWRVVYYPNVAVVHYGGQSAQKNLALKISSFYQKRLYFAKKHFGQPASLIIRFASCLELAIKWFMVASVLRLDPKERRDRLKGYRRALRVVLRGTPTAGGRCSSDSLKTS